MEVKADDTESLMEEGYTIRQTARLYDITTETLYYYEQIGLVVPRRNPVNGYRLYGPDDFARLNVIQALRKLDFSLDRIGQYLDNRTFDATLSLIDEEVEHVDSQMRYLASIKRGLLSSLQKYTQAMTSISPARTVIVHRPLRHCALVSDHMIDYDRIPFAFAHYTALHHETLQILNTLTCYQVDASRPVKGWFPPKAILLYCPDPGFSGDYDLPAGTYASCTFVGSFARCRQIHAKMLEDLKTMGYRVDGDPLEFCLIGEYESNDFDEYVSRMEIPVVPNDVESSVRNGS